MHNTNTLLTAINQQLKDNNYHTEPKYDYHNNIRSITIYPTNTTITTLAIATILPINNNLAIYIHHAQSNHRLDLENPNQLTQLLQNCPIRTTVNPMPHAKP